MFWTLLIVTLLSTVLFAPWGPGHHLEFAERVLRRRRELLSAPVAKLLHENRSSYLYGNIAADIINFKAYGGSYNHCHRWSIIEDMRELADSDSEEAFILGYLSHLAADSISHNHFVPYHLARYARASGLGHLYWEMNADRFIAESRWQRLAELRLDERLVELDELVNATVPKKALPMRTNKLIFNHVLLISHRDQWRRGMEKIHPRKRVTLTRGFLARFQKAAVGRVRLALRPRGIDKLLEVDPNGKRAIASAMSVRKDVVKEFRAGEARNAEAELRAKPFLEGMESPPRHR